MENKYIVFVEEGDSYEQLSIPLSSIEAKSYFDRVCTQIGKSYIICLVVEYKFNEDAELLL